MCPRAGTQSHSHHTLLAISIWPAILKGQFIIGLWRQVTNVQLQVRKEHPERKLPAEVLSLASISAEVVHSGLQLSLSAGWRCK